MVKDFVCGTEIDETKAGASCEYKGRTYYFCASDCRDRFLKFPEEYILY